MSSSHDCFTVTNSGLNVNPLWPHIGASPDGLVNCKCCGQGTCEIKCPFCIRGKSVKEMPHNKNSCLIHVDGKLALNGDLAYYYQVQAQIFVCNVDYCDFIVWTERDVHIERILPDIAFWDQVVSKAADFFQQAILPELTGKLFTKPN